MRKWIISLFVLVFALAFACVGFLYYIKPDQSLDLAYKEVPLNDRALSMAKRVSTEMKLTEEDVVNLATKSLAKDPQVEKDIRVTGAHFELEGDLLYADLNVEWNKQFAAGIRLVYRLRWEDPNVVANIEKAKVKGIKLPTSFFSDRIIPIGDQLPKFLEISGMKWEDGGVKVQFKKPSLKDLRKLIG